MSLPNAIKGVIGLDGGNSLSKISLDKKPEVVICRNCRFENNSDNAFCSSCGSRLSQLETDLKASQESDLTAFITKNAGYYITKFNKIKQTNKTYSWNWAAFFLSGYWMLYRKMYSLGALFIVAWFILSFFPIARTAGLGISVVIGLYGNKYYLDYVDKEVLNSNSMDLTARQRYFEKKGGTSLGIPIGIFIAQVILYAIFD